MHYVRILILIAVLAGILGSIYYLESRKASPLPAGSSTDDDIRIEDQVTIEGEETLEDQDEGAMEPQESVAEETETISMDPPKQVITKTRADRIAEKAGMYERAKEISTPDGFINTEPFTVTELIGKKVILIDIWTYSCINCQRTTPYLNSWHEKYADDGLVIVGLHTPEFEFEKEYDNVLAATRKFMIEYPVVLDNDYSTWRAYNNRYWPRKYLIDIDGFVVYDHIGEGAYSDTERRIVELLNEKNEVLGMSAVALDNTQPENVDQVDFSKIRTRESYFGSARIEYLSNLPRPSCLGTICDYKKPESVPLNLFALVGEWHIQSEEAVLKDEGGAIISHFSASKVNLVAGSEEPVVATIYLDGEVISDTFAGSDVVDGKVTITNHDLYNLVDLDMNYGEHILEIRFEESGVSAFAFTFG
jgi:thiol-disulfide isomerase/thioredoxin